MRTVPPAPRTKLTENLRDARGYRRQVKRLARVNAASYRVAAPVLRSIDHHALGDDRAAVEWMARTPDGEISAEQATDRSGCVVYLKTHARLHALGTRRAGVLG